MPRKSKSTEKTTDQNLHEYLGREYTSLINLYIHHENQLSLIFNFYMTLLTTIAGAIVVLIQINKDDLFTILPTTGIILLFSMMLGITVQEALLNKAVDITQVTRAINLLKQEALKDHQEYRAYVEYLHNPFSRMSPEKTSKNWIDRMGNRFWFFRWLGSHQLFISIFNSLEIGALIIVSVFLISPAGLDILEVVVVSLLASFISLYIHAIYVNFEYKRRSKIWQLRMSDYPELPADQ